MAQEKEYFAFISYQRKDEEWAERLRKKLEHYRLPSNVRKQDASLPKEIRPIFRDALELTGGFLAKEIETALQQSKYLIVICSPNSAKSPWVNKEIQTFINLGREDRIIPFIIDGTPFSNYEETECFPPALRSLKGENELLGININDLGRDAAAIKVVARMFGLKFDTLWQRYEREQRKRRWMVIVSVVLLAIVALVVAGFFINMSRTISQQNTSLLKASERMRADSILQAQHIKRITEDSISLAEQNDSIQRQYALIEHQNNEIATERDNVKSANYAMNVNFSRVIAEKANQLVDEGDAYSARILALEVLPKNLEHPDRPYTPEAEAALRKASMNNSYVLQGHSKPVVNAIYSPDGNYIVSGSSDGIIKIWNADTKKCIKDLLGHSDCICQLSYSSDGKYIVSASNDNTIKIWNVKTGKCINTLYGHKSNIYCASFSPDAQKVVSCSRDESIKIWESHTGTCLKTLNGHYRTVNTVFFNAKGNNIISSSKDMIKIWDVETGNCINTINRESGFMFRYALFSPNENEIAYAIMSFGTGGQGSIIIQDIKTGEKRLSLKEHTDDIHTISYSHNGKYIVSASRDKTVKIWDAKSGRCLQTIHQSCIVNSAYFSPDDSKIIMSLMDNTIHIWDLDQSKNYRTIGGGAGSVQFANYSPNGEFIISSSLDTKDAIKIWNASTGKLQKTLLGHSGSINSSSFSRDGKLLISASNDNSVKIWSVKQRECIKTLKGHTNSVYDAVISPDKQIVASASYDKTIRIWDVNTSICLKILDNHEGPVWNVDFSPNGIYLVSASGDKTIKIWEVRTGKCIMTLRGHSAGVRDADYSPDGKFIVSASDDHSIRIWDATNGKCTKILTGHNLGVLSVDFSHDGNYLISSSSDETIRLWDVKTGKCAQTLIHDAGPFNTVHFSPDDRHIVASANNNKCTVNIWDFMPLQELIDKTRELMKNRVLTPEEKRKYYLE